MTTERGRVESSTKPHDRSTFKVGVKRKTCAKELEKGRELQPRM
jgi:hypothetical protein